MMKVWVRKYNDSRYVFEDRDEDEWDSRHISTDGPDEGPRRMMELLGLLEGKNPELYRILRNIDTDLMKRFRTPMKKNAVMDYFKSVERGEDEFSQEKYEQKTAEYERDLEEYRKGIPEMNQEMLEAICQFETHVDFIFENEDETERNKAISSAVKKFGRIVSPAKWNEDIEITFYGKESSEQLCDSSAEGHNKKLTDNRYFIAVKGDVPNEGTVIHELGHVIDQDSRNGLRDECDELGRFFSEKKTSGVGYFPTPDSDYSLRLYDDGKYLELISTGVEKIYKDPFGFFVKSPLHFVFTVCALQ